MKILLEVRINNFIGDGQTAHEETAICHNIKKFRNNQTAQIKSQSLVVMSIFQKKVVITLLGNKVHLQWGTMNKSFLRRPSIYIAK